jgi:hypothetical protein
MNSPDITPNQRWDVAFPRIEKFTKYMIGGLLAVESAVLIARMPDDNWLNDQSASIAVETDPVIAQIIPIETVRRSEVVTLSTGILPPEITQPECVPSSIAWLPNTVARWHPYVYETAAKFALPPAMLDILMTFESLGHPSVQSSVGALGLIQIMPSTANSLTQQLGMPPLDLTDPASNIFLSGQYIRNYIDNGMIDLSQGFNTEVARQIAIVYNGGPGRLSSYLHGGGRESLPAETIFYSDHVARAWDEQNLPTSQSLNEYLSHAGAQRLVAEAATLGTPPC